MTWTLSAFSDEAALPIDEQIEALQRAGLTRVDLRGVDEFNISDLPIDRAKTVKTKLDDAGITVGMYGSPIGKIDIAEDLDIDLKKLDHLGKLAPVLGCTWVRIFSYYNKQNQPYDKWKSVSLERLGKLRDRAAQLGLVLYHENEKGIFGERYAENSLLADELRDGNAFRMIFDFDNYNHAGDDVWANWERLRDRVDAFHLKDSTGQGQHVPAGQGAGRIRDILADAQARGWDGPLSLEPHLAHSAAVMATGPSGVANQSLKDMTPGECFQIAAEAAKALIDEVGAVYA